MTRGPDGLTRLERGAQQRRQRARAHLERVSQRSLRFRLRRSAQAVLALASLVAGAGLGPPLLGAAAGSGAVERIHVGGARSMAPEQLARAAGIAAGSAPQAVDVEQLARRISELPWVQRARALRLPGGALLVGVEERVPVALAVAGDRSAFVDALGTAFAPLEGEAPADLPRLRLPEATGFELGAVDLRLAEALELAYALPGHGLALPEEIGVAPPDDPEGTWLRLPGLAARVLLGREQPLSRLPGLARLLSAGRPEVARAESIDLRFADRAVLRETPSQGGAAQAAAAGGRR